MAKKKKKNNSPQVPKERSLKTVLNERIRFSAFYFPKKEDPDGIYKVPDPIVKFYERLYDCGDLFDPKWIEIIYSIQGELCGYYSIDYSESGRVITFVFFDLGEEFRDRIIFKLDMLNADLGSNLSYNVTTRCCFLPCEVFYNNEISDELINRYANDYEYDGVFYSKVSSFDLDILYKGRLLRSFNKRSVLQYDKDDKCVHDAIYDLRKYANCLNDKTVIDTFKFIDELVSSASFGLDRLHTEDGRLGRYASDIHNSSFSYVGFEKIYFILPNVSDDVMTEFISSVFESIDNEVFRDTFMHRFGFFIEKRVDVNDTKDIVDDKRMELVFVENDYKRTTTKYIEVFPGYIYKRYYKKHHNEFK